MQPFNNQSLLSDYYLTELVKDDKFWEESQRQTEEVHRKIKEIFQKARENLTGLNEAETEHRIIRPIFDILGHIYSLQPSVDSPEGIRRPDFAFFVDTQARDEAEREHKGKSEFFATCLAIGDAKHWDRALDKKTKGAGDPFNNYNPSYQIDFYLRATDSRWGILSNGRLWRLYNRDTSYRYDVFYEVDLPALLERSNDLSRYYNEEFNYFFAFFRKEAFLKDVSCEERSNQSFLGRAYKGSLDYAAKLSEELKENVYEALRLLAEGFLRFPANGLTENDLNAIRENIFVLIYRILFLLYAEDRRLLPVDNPNYQAYSLRNLAHEIAQKLDARAYLSPTMVGYWSRLIDFFRIINEGDDSLDVPPYNGGLFDDGKHPFLADYKIGDSYLAQAIDQLTRAQAAGQNPPSPFSKGGSRGFVSYRDMEIRHIGSIYEGLLEHHLRLASSDLAVVKEEGREKFIPLASADSKKVGVRGSCRVIKSYPCGSVYLETDKGERKATGSYYTPDYIVKYIVENTVGPLLEEKKKQALERSQNAQKEIESLAKSISAYKAQLSKATMPPTKSGCSTFMQRQYQEKIDREQKRLEALRVQLDPNSLLISEIQQIKVLDPAMGSGHFLVEATDFLARALVEALGASPQEVGVRGSCRVTEEDIRWARREVVERCIYGVDLNPLAVELAKLSLWLYTASKGHPLSFLEHHLRLGNSLIGAKIEEIGRLPAKAKGKRMLRELPSWEGPGVGEETAEYGQQLTLFDENAFTQSAFKMVGGAQNIEKMPTNSVVQVKKKEEILATVLDANREPYRKIADLWTSAFFGTDISQPIYQQAMSLLQGKTTTLSENVLSPYIARAEELRKQKHFFHWELEFPEVFFDEHGRKKENPGFDAVIGNPPYIRFHALNSEEIPYFANVFKHAAGQFDAFALMVEKGFEKLRGCGYFGFIIPDLFLRGLQYEDLRRAFLSGASVNYVVELGDGVFPDVQMPTCLFLYTKKFLQNSVVIFHTGTEKQQMIIVPQETLLKIPGVPLDARAGLLLSRFSQNSMPMGKITSVARGIEIGKDKVNLTRFDSTDIPVLSGNEIQRYVPDGEAFVSVKVANAFNKDATIFAAPKIMIRETGGVLLGCFDNQGVLTLRTLHNIHVIDKKINIKYILALLNSKLLQGIFEICFKQAGEVFPKIRIAQEREFPIRRISFNTPKEERERLVEEGKRLCAAWVATQLEEKKDEKGESK